MGRPGAAARGHWVMEQQPGPVNWAVHNPSPAPGMVRLWSLEAFAHGASTVSYFRCDARHARDAPLPSLARILF
jgi:beta-galactosidase GanA